MASGTQSLALITTQGRVFYGRAGSPRLRQLDSLLLLPASSSLVFDSTETLSVVRWEEQVAWQSFSTYFKHMIVCSLFLGWHRLHGCASPLPSEGMLIIVRFAGGFLANWSLSLQPHNGEVGLMVVNPRLVFMFPLTNDSLWLEGAYIGSLAVARLEQCHPISTVNVMLVTLVSSWGRGIVMGLLQNGALVAAFDTVEDPVNDTSGMCCNTR